MSNKNGKSVRSDFEKLIRRLKKEVTESEQELSHIQAERNEVELKRDRHLNDLAAQHAYLVLNEQVDPISEAVKHKLAAHVVMKNEVIHDVAFKAIKVEEAEKEFTCSDGIFMQRQQQFLDDLQKSEEYLKVDSSCKLLKQKLDQLKSSLYLSFESVNNKKIQFLRDDYFQHLQKRKFGTPYYRGLFLFAWLDRWLSKRINYEKAVRDFETLSSFQGYATNELDKTEEELKKLEGLRSAVHEEFIQKHKINSFKEKLDEDRKALSKAREELKLSEKLLKEFEGLTDSSFNNAVSLIKELISQRPLEDLESLFAEVSSMGVDRALKGYQNNSLILKDFDEKLKKARAKKNAADSSLERGNDLFRRFKAMGGDNSNRIYDSSLDVESFILTYAYGTLASDAFEDSLKKNSRIKQESRRSGYESIRSSGSSSSDSWSSSSSFGGDSSSSWSTSSSFGGDSSSSYTTTDRF